LTLGDGSERQSTKSHPLQQCNLLVHRGEHHAYLPLAAFVDDDAVAVGSLPLELADLRGPRHLFLYLDAFFESFPIVLRQTARESDIILLLVLETGMRQLVRQFSIIGEDEQSRAVLVKASRRMQPRLAQVLRKEVYHGGATAVVLGRGQVALGLVHGDVDTAGSLLTCAPAGNLYLVLRRVDRLSV